METSFSANGESAWNCLLNQVQSAVVFIDSKAGESLHWNVGVESLLLKGALAIKELNAFRYATEQRTSFEKAVFFTASLYSFIKADICDIVCQSSFQTVLLVTLPMHDSSFIIRNELLQWMSFQSRDAKNLCAEVHFFNYFSAPLTDTVLLLPPFRDLFPPLDLQKLQLGGREDILSLKDQECAESLALFLDTILDEIGAADVIFSMGSLSGLVAVALEALPSAHQRRKRAQHQVSLVIVDRTFDLSTPASMDSKCFLDKLLCTLPHLPDHSNDVAVNMSQLAQVTVDSALDESLLPGCLAHPDNESRAVLEWLLHKKDRDILINLHQVLRSKFSSDKKFATRVKPEVLEKDVRQFRGNLDKIRQNCGILQIALGVVQALTGDNAEEHDLILSTEKLLRQNVFTSVEVSELTGLLPQITKLVLERHIRGLSLDAILRFMLLIYSLVGTDMTFPLKDEVQLQAAFSTALFEDQEYPGLIHETLLPLEATKERVDIVTFHIFTLLKAVSHARRNLLKYKSLLKVHGKSMPIEYTPFLQRILKDVLDSSKPTIPDLSCRTGRFRDLLKTGFSLLMNKQQPPTSQHPGDQPNLFFFVVGGITGGEIRSLQETWTRSAQSKAGTFIIGSTRLLSPNDTLQAVLRSAPSH